MKTTSLLIIALLGLIPVLHAEIVEVDMTPEAIAKALVACLESELKEIQTKKDDAVVDEAAMRMNMTLRSSNQQAILATNQILGYAKNGEYDNAKNYVQRLSGYLANTDCKSMLPLLREALELAQQRETEAIEEQFGVLKEELSSLLISAQQPEQLDPYYARMQNLNKTVSGQRSLRHISTELNALSNIVSSWQEYLVYLDTDDIKQAISRLSNTNSYLKQVPVVPRSWVLRRQQELLGKDRTQKTNTTPPYSVASVVAGIDSLDDLELAREKLVVLRGYRQVSSDATRQLGYITHFEKAASLIQNQNPYLGLSAMKSWSAHGADTEWVDTLKDQVREDTIILVTPDAYRADAEIEGMEMYINKVASAMQEEEDWLALWTFLKVVNERLSDGHYRGLLPGTGNDIRAIERYLYAERLEEVGELADALSNYKYVLNTTGKYGPYEQAKVAIVMMREKRGVELASDEKAKAELSGLTRRLPDSRGYPSNRSGDNTARIEATVEKVVEQKMAAWALKQQEDQKKAMAPSASKKK